MRRRLLVLTTVHHPDDVRIRGKLIEALASEWDVTYACRGPGPARREKITVRLLSGGRLVRNIRALGIIMRGEYEVLSLHDPETLPAGLLATWFRRRTVVFDVHENVPAQMMTKEWLPRLIKRPTAVITHWMLRLAERSIEITLAERGYASLFRRSHPVFENLLSDAPLPASDGSGSGVVYLGDVTEARGIFVLVRAAGRGIPGEKVTVIGQCSADVEGRIREIASELDVTVELTGRLDHARALEKVASARIGVSPLLDIPNYRWSMPTKILEYLAVGVPVVASDLPGTREVVEKLSGVVLVPPGDVDAWANALGGSIGDNSFSEAARLQAPAIRGQFRFPAEGVRAFYRGLAD